MTLVSRVPPGLKSRVVAPGDDRYEDLRHSYAYRGSPALIVLCESADDVSGGVLLARSTGTPLSVRSGGHGVSSSSTNDGGIVLDLSPMNGIDVLDPASGLVQIGPGARWGDVAGELGRFGLAIGSGDSGDVGVGGLVLAGGIGLLARAHGLTIDALRAVSIVTADGVLRRATATDNPDLFWAVRGGGGQFGVAVSFEFLASRVHNVVHATISYDVSDLAGLVEHWARAVEETPRELTAFLYLSRGPDDTAETTVVYASDDERAARDALKTFHAIAPVIASTIAITDYASVVARRAGTPHGDAPAELRCGLLTHVTPETANAIAGLLSSDAAFMVQLRAVGGAVNDVEPAATAYAHRHQNFCVVAIATDGNRASLWSAWDKLLPCLDGVYAAFDTASGPEQTLAAYPSATLARLAAVKAKFDPNNLFEPNFVWS